MLSALFLAALLAVSSALVHHSVEDVQELLVDWNLVNLEDGRAVISNILTRPMECEHRTMSLRKRLQSKDTMDTFCLQ